MTALLKTVNTMPAAEARSDAILNALPLPVIVIDKDNRIVEANLAAQAFLQMSASMLSRFTLAELVPFGSPVLSMVEAVRTHGGSMSEYRVDVGTPRIGQDKIVDLYATPSTDQPGDIVIMLQEKTIAEKIDRQLSHRGAARSISAMGSMLAHEIKNPLSGIRGAAQLLEATVEESDRDLLRLICDETDRIVKLVERFEDFSDERPVEREPVNIHSVLEHVKRLATSGFARHIRFNETYDPSLPPISGSRDQLIQVFLNLVKNAAEAIGADAVDGTIELSTAFRPGVKIATPGSRERIALPLEITVKDNGPGVPHDIVQTLFDPFVTTKSTGSGLGLALVSKIIRDHGGIVECDSLPRRTVFRVLLSMHSARDGRRAEIDG
ncbi:MAG: PAS domain-containing protein [Alphaproteobacteria bacterium]|nr:PAS domain-containing protein [Alphaproteobacteria bacterium]